MRILRHLTSLLIACLLAVGQPGNLQAETLVAAEAFIDTDPGEGAGVPLDVAVDGTIDSAAEVLRGVLDLYGLGIGVHVLHIRYRDSTGLWSPTTKQSFYVPAAISGPGTGNPSNLVAAVGRIDEGPAIALTADDGAFDDIVETVTLSEPVSAVYHSATIRFLDTEGVWSTGESTEPTFAGVAGLSGRVTDAGTGLPVAGVQVWVGGGHGGLSDSNGFYTIGPLPYGSAPVATYRSGYVLYNTTVDFTGSTRLDIALNRDFAACSSTGTLSGVVRDGASNQVLPGVEVNLGALSATTNASGAYTFAGVTSGVQNVAVSNAGYLGYNQPVSMCGNTSQNIPLTKAATTVDMTYGSGWSADPVNTATGNYTFQRTDLNLPGIGYGFAFERGYNSQGPDGQIPVDGPLGFGWTHNYNTSLDDDGDVTIHWGDGSIQTFALNGSGGYVPQPGVFDSLIHEADGSWTLEKKNGMRYSFDPVGVLQTISDRNGNTQTLTYTGGRLTEVIDTAGRAINFTYKAGRIKEIRDPLQPVPRTVLFTYDAAGDLITSTDPRGGVTTYTYDANHQMLTATDPRNHVFVQNTYDPALRVVTSQQDAKNSPTSYVYDAVNNRTTITDPLNNITIHYHDENKRLIREEDALGNNAVYIYDDAGNRTHVMDKNGNLTQYGYDARGNVTSKLDVLGNITAITYDGFNNPLSRTDALGNTTQFQYDSNGNLTKTIDSLGDFSTISYLPSGLPEIITDARGNPTTNTYDTQGNLIEVQDALLRTTVHDYDEVGRRTSTTNARGFSTSFSYDENDNLRTVTDPDTKVITHTYDGNNNRESTLDKKGNLTQFTYDVKDLLTITTDAHTKTTTNSYDLLDRRTGFVDRNSNFTAYDYDEVGNLTKVTDALLNQSTFTYDANGNRLTATDPLTHTNKYTYDPLNRRTSEEDPLGHVSTTVYDVLGRVISVINAKQQVTGFSYDSLGRLMEVRDSNGGIVYYTYDENGNRRSMTNPNNHTTQYEYDVLNRLITKTEPEGNITRYDYDEVGNLQTLTKANGTIIQYGYDNLNRLESITYPDNSVVNISYDANGNRKQMVDSLGAQDYVYDELNRMTSHTDAFNNVVLYGYDDNGNRVSLTYPGNNTVNYAYDGFNRLTDVTDWLANNTHYTYDAASRLTQVTNSNGTTTSYSYDEADRLTGLSNLKSDASVISSYSYTLDELGNHISEDRDEPLFPTMVPGITSYMHDAENRLTHIDGVANSFDNNGNQTGKGLTDSYVYDFEGRLVSRTSPTSSHSYDYDGLGGRYQRTENGLTTRYILDTTGSLTNVLAEVDTVNTINAYYVYGLGLISRIQPDGMSQYYHYDYRGSTIALSDNAENITDILAYDPFGKIVNLSGSTANTFRYLGKYGVSDEGDLIYIRARYYDAEQQRFVAKDPKTGSDNDSQSLNRYIYSLNNPIKYIDITGLTAADSEVSLKREVDNQLWKNQVPARDHGYEDIKVFWIVLCSADDSLAAYEACVKSIAEDRGLSNLSIGLTVASEAGNVSSAVLSCIPGNPLAQWTSRVNDVARLGIDAYETNQQIQNGDLGAGQEFVIDKFGDLAVERVSNKLSEGVTLNLDDAYVEIDPASGCATKVGYRIIRGGGEIVDAVKQR